MASSMGQLSALASAHSVSDKLLVCMLAPPVPLPGDAVRSHVVRVSQGGRHREANPRLQGGEGDHSGSPPHVGDLYRHVLLIRVALGVGDHQGHFIHVVPARVSGRLVVGVGLEGENARGTGLEDTELAGISARQQPRKVGIRVCNYVKVAAGVDGLGSAYQLGDCVWISCLER